MKRIPLPLVLLLSSITIGGCDCGNVGSEEDARIAYLGLDQVVLKSLDLGFAGFNAASSANIPAQEDEGDESGDIKITGEVDQGASANKGMRLDAALTEYSDGPVDDPETDEDDDIKLQFDTKDGEPLAVEMKLRDIPDGTLEDGILKGTVTMSGDLEGDIDVDVTFSGEIEEDPDNAGKTQRVEGETDVTGTITSGNGEFEIDETI